MSRTFFLAWNKKKSIRTPYAAFFRSRRIGALLLALALAFPACALALPEGGQISAGSGNIGQSGTTLTVTQTSPKLAINWQGFSIGQSETVTFRQPSSSAIALNRVFGQNPSQILGGLNANGQVFVLNPNGVLFGSTAQVNVGGLVASSLNLSDADFLAGNYIFSNSSKAGSVLNQGTLSAVNGGYIALLAPEVRNEGVLVATLGTALLAAGDKVTLTLNNGSLLSYAIDQGALNTLVENKHLIQADGGQVILSAKSADLLTSSVVNNTGIIEARTIQNQGGVIKLLGDMHTGQVNVGGTLDASAPNGGDGGFVETSAAHVTVVPGSKITTHAPQGTSGNWLIDPADYTIAAAALAFNLGNTNVTILSSQGTVNPAGNGDIFVYDAVSWNSANSLTLSAVRDINVNSAITNGGTGAINLNAAAAVAVNADLGTMGTIAITAPTGLTQDVASTITTGTGLTVDVGDASSASGIIAGAGGLTKSGSGLLILTGNNTYAGATTINAGTLLIGNDSGLGTAPGTATPGHLTFNGGTLEIQNLGSVALHANRGIALAAGGGKIDTATGNTTTYAGIIAGSGALTKGLNGTLEFSGANSYTGLTTVRAGTLRLAGGAAIADTGAVNLDTSGAVLRLSASETIGSLTGVAGTSVNLLANTLTTGDAGNTTFTGVISGTGNLSKQGAGTFTLSGLNTYSGMTTVHAGTLAYGITNALASGAVNVNGGTLDIGGHSDTVGAVTLTSGSIAGTTGVLTGTSYGVQAGTISARLAGAVALTKTTGGTVTLSGANTYAGATTVSAGKLGAANAAALGSTAGSTTVADAATLEIANVAIGSETVTLNGTGVGGAGALTGTGTASLSGPVTLATASALGATAGNTLTLSGTIEGSGALDVLGGGTVTLGGTIGSSTALASLNGASGTMLAINGGLVRISGAQTYGGGTTFGGETTLRTTSGGSVSATGAVTATAGTLTLDTGAGDATFSNSENNFSTVAATSGKNISFVDANGLAIAGINATGLVDVRTQTGDLTLNNTIATTSTSANAVTLIADVSATPNGTGSGGNFKNAGAAAITTGAGGAWRIYTGNPTGTNRGGLTEGGKRYNVDDGSDPLASGNRLYFRIQPTLTLTADNKTKTYGDANPAFTHSHGGLIDSDLLGAALGSGPSFTVDGTTSTSGKLTAGTPHNITPSAATATSLGYSLSYANGALTVNQKALAISATGVNKVYDTGTGATVTYADNRVTGDLLTIGGTAAYLDKNVGTGKTVNVSDITLGNVDAGNYTFNTTTATIADITRANLAVTGVSAANKEYNGNTEATLVGAAAISALAGDTVTPGVSGSGVFVDKNVATGKSVTVSGYTISGADAGNYALLQPTGLTANITARPLAISATGINKVYDGTTAASVTYADDRVAGDLLTITGTASYLNKDVGPGKTVNVSGITLGNADAGNYTLLQPSGLVADITPRALSVDANAATRNYTGVAFFGGNGVTYSGFANGETAAVLGGALAYGGTSQGAINAGNYLIVPSGLISDNYGITYINGVLTINPAAAAGGIPPILAGAIVALPGGDTLLTAFNGAKGVAGTPVNPGVFPSGRTSDLQPTVTPASVKQSDRKATTETSDSGATQPQDAGVSAGKTEIVEQVGSLGLVNGGVKLPTNTKNTEGERQKSDSDKNDEHTTKKETF